MTNPSDRSGPEASRSPAPGGSGDATVPMLRPPSRHTPGEKEPCYSPSQFFALTQVGTDPGDDPALWLTEEKVKVVHREGILLLEQYFYDKRLDRYVTGRTPAHKRPDLVVRYNRALLARHVLDEVIVYLQEPNGSYRELCRPRAREGALAEIDVSLAVGYQDKYRDILAKKRLKAQEAYLNQESGAEAVARLRERSRARAERQKRSRSEPIVATPDEQARDPVDPGLQSVVDEATGEATRDRAAPTSAQAGEKGAKAGRQGRKSSGKSKGFSGAKRDSHGKSRSGESGPTVEGLLGGSTGFENNDDD